MMKTIYKYLQKKDDSNYLQIFAKNNFPTPSSSCLSVPMSLSEIELNNSENELPMKTFCSSDLI